MVFLDVINQNVVSTLGTALEIEIRAEDPTSASCSLYIFALSIGLSFIFGSILNQSKNSIQL